MMGPFRIDVAQDIPGDLHNRLARTRWPEDVANTNWHCGANVASVNR
jgi:hypothetical protein